MIKEKKQSFEQLMTMRQVKDLLGMRFSPTTIRRFLQESAVK